MRLWSISPSYLDSKGLVALWRETLLGKSVLLKGEYIKCIKCNSKTVKKVKFGEDKFCGIKIPKEISFCHKCKGTGKIKTPYYMHPQLERFKKCQHPIAQIKAYLRMIWEEAHQRGYKFDWNKIEITDGCLIDEKLTVTKGQLVFEINHLQKKLKIRDIKKYKQNNKTLCFNSLKANPLFEIVDGEVEGWEKGVLNEKL